MSSPRRNRTQTNPSFSNDCGAQLQTALTTAFKGHPNSKPPRRHRQPPRSQLPRPRIRHSFTFQPPPKGQTGTRKRRVPALGLNRERWGRTLVLHSIGEGGTTRFSSLKHRPADCFRIFQSLLQPLCLPRTTSFVRPIGPARLSLRLASFPRTGQIKRSISWDQRVRQPNSFLPTVGERCAYNFLSESFCSSTRNLLTFYLKTLNLISLAKAQVSMLYSLRNGGRKEN